MTARISHLDFTGFYVSVLGVVKLIFHNARYISYSSPSVHASLLLIFETVCFHLLERQADLFHLLLHSTNACISQV